MKALEAPVRSGDPREPRLGYFVSNLVELGRPPRTARLRQTRSASGVDFHPPSVVAVRETRVVTVLYGEKCSPPSGSGSLGDGSSTRDWLPSRSVPRESS